MFGRYDRRTVSFMEDVEEGARGVRDVVERERRCQMHHEGDGAGRAVVAHRNHAVFSVRPAPWRLHLRDVLVHRSPQLLRQVLRPCLLRKLPIKLPALPRSVLPQALPGAPHGAAVRQHPRIRLQLIGPLLNRIEGNLEEAYEEVPAHLFPDMHVVVHHIKVPRSVPEDTQRRDPVDVMGDAVLLEPVLFRASDALFGRPCVVVLEDHAPPLLDGH
mmetsp:Transcript_34907/g.81583  ORF Transcript_34907/g.81583 Transcript_34907/m.81583 type:complete len:216 (+) Transcript_34907:736-1383(+)